MDTSYFTPERLLDAYDDIANAAMAHLDAQSDTTFLTTRELAQSLAAGANVHQWIWNVLSPRVLAHRPALARYAHKGPAKMVMGKTAYPLIWHKPKVTS